MIAAQDRSTWGLVSEIAGQPDLVGKSFLLSPRSVRSALSLLCLGARGPTRDEIDAFLGAASEEALQNDPSAAARDLRRAESPIRSATGLFTAPRTTLRTDFVERAEQALSASVEPLRAGPEDAARQINTWVSRATEGRIPSIVSSVGSAVSLLVVSALYFKAEWAEKFNPMATFDRPFQLRSGEQVPRSAMHMTATLPLWRGAEWQGVELAYRQSDLAMGIVLSADPARATLDGAAIRAGFDAARPELVQLQLPRFDVRASLSLSAALMHLGVESVFEPAAADLSGISEERLFASDVIHEARVTVTEEGTEAAAATAIPLVQSLDRRQKVPFAVDRPFWFFLRDRRGGDIVFAGRVEDPKGA